MVESEALDYRAFRQEARAWLKANFPPALAHVPGLIFQGDRNAAQANPDYQLWRQRMTDKGWGVPTWASRYGGADLTPAWQDHRRGTDRDRRLQSDPQLWHHDARPHPARIWQ